MNLVPNQRLSIVIPTYNRADFLDYSLETHVPLAKEYGVQIFISDNASEDNTPAVVEKWIKKYPLIRYHRNATNLGFDGNFELVLKQPKTDYVWLLSDTSRMSEDVFLKVISCVSDGYDAIVLNDTGRVDDVLAGVLTDQNLILEKLGWHMTKISALVFSRAILESVSFKRYYGTCLVHVGVMFEYLSGRADASVLWLPECSIVELRRAGCNKVSWEARTFEIWVEKWASLILSLPPAYGLSSKKTAIQKHNGRSGVFSVRNLIKLRAGNMYSVGTIKSIFDYIFIAVPPRNIFWVFVVSILPSRFLGWLISVLKSTRHGR